MKTPDGPATFVEPIRLSVLMPVYNERHLVATCIERVLAFRHPRVREIEIVVVDDHSTDGTREVLRELAEQHAEIRLFLHDRNQGKGAAVRTAIAHVTGDLSVIQDADLEYRPSDWVNLLRPFFEANADAVYGSRFLPLEYSRVLYFKHSIANRLLTFLSNMATDLSLTDMETCYKMVRTELLRSIPIRSNDFSFEPEITAKLAKRGAVIYEAPISYAGRTYLEGKKISARHSVTALWSILKWLVLDDLYAEDEFGSNILSSLSHVRRFNLWLADFLRGDVGDRVLEIGAGIGNLTMLFQPRPHYLATDVNEHHLSFLRNAAMGKPYMAVRKLDVAATADFQDLGGRFDTVICLNVIEHVHDEASALRNIYSTLEPSGKAIILVPRNPRLYTSLDAAVQHVKRYEDGELDRAMEAEGFEIVSRRDFNRAGVPGWLLNGKVLRRTSFPRAQLKIYNLMIPLIARVDRLLPWRGLSTVVVGRRRT